MVTFDQKNQLEIIKLNGCFELSEVDFNQDFTLYHFPLLTVLITIHQTSHKYFL